MYKYAFVILHFETIKVTRECVASIRKYIDEKKCEIVIVDNGSKNQSGIELQKEYEKYNNIHILINAENKGFAKGNNVGYRYAKDVLKCDFVMLINSDTKIVQKDFLEIIERKYKEASFAVMGPLITKDGIPTNDNPRREEIFKPNRIKLFILFNQVQYLLSILSLDAGLDWLFKKYAYLRRKNKNETYDTLECKENVGLHGCCLILSPLYSKHFQGLNEKTFMYLEEEILHYEVLGAGLKMLYCPELKIEHMEAYTTGEVCKSPVKKRRFVYKNSIDSAKVMLDLWKEGNNE